MPIGLTNTTFVAPRTVFDLISGSYRIAKILGRGEALDAVSANEAGYKLNDIIEQATIEQLFSAYETEIQFPLIAGKGDYTIGTSGAEVTANRPASVISGYVRKQGIDYPVSISHSKQDHDGIRDKASSSGGWPSFVYYQAAFPFGRVYVHPIPADSDTILFLTIYSEISPYSSLQDAVLVPPTYYAWLEYKLAQRLAPDYGQIWSEDNQIILDDIKSALIRNNIRPMPRISTETSCLASDSSSGRYRARSDGWGRYG